jgi:uncharacterized protein YbjT (DUF2867 family)
MKVLIFGATGMVGQGVLLECLRDQGVNSVVTLGRTATGNPDPKVREIVHRDPMNLTSLQDRLTGFDACFFCLGIASTGMKETDYERITYGYTLVAAETLSRIAPGLTFIFVSGAGTDSSEQGRIMWARIKGRAENALLRLPLKAYMFRPGFIQPLDGIQSKTKMYRVLYNILRPVLPLLRRAFANQILSTREIGQAMLAVARHGYSKHIMEIADIRRVLDLRA